MGGMCSECFADFPVRKLTATQVHLMLDGKLFQYKRPKTYILDQMDLMDATMKKVIRSWDVPDQDYPIAISEDGKTLYLNVAFTKQDEVAGQWQPLKRGMKPKQEYPNSLFAISEHDIKFVEAKLILSKQTSEEITKHPIDPQNSYILFKRFRVGKKSFIVRFSAPCT